jgi:hypothetical protein
MGDFRLLGVLKDERLNTLIERIQASAQKRPIHSQGRLLIVSGYTPAGEIQTYFYDTSLKGDVMEDVRPKFNGRMVMHEAFGPEYRCLTDIVDDAPEALKGSWIIAGRSHTGKKLARVYRTKNEMLKEREKLFIEIKGIAVVHEIGTTEYTFVEVKDWIYENENEIIIDT